MYDNVIKRYSKRPIILNTWCLADYVSQLDVVYPDKNGKSEINEEVNDDDPYNESNECFDNSFTKLSLL